jgi:glycolate oxidase
MISDEAYKGIERAVGAENVSREPAVLDGYVWQTLMNEDPKVWVPRPVAVSLPASTEEVQAVVRVCNQHGLRFKAFSTGWGPWAGPSGEGVVSIDMRRMDRILKIDEKNMYAVVEPYICGALLQAEAMKVGLNAHIIGAGPAYSPLASATSMQGMGWDSVYMSHSSRNVLGVEWVLPNGEVLRLGAPGSGLDWFSGDGPGPSLRGIMRGNNGALGGLGVFTKVALKLYNWPGPARVATGGTVVDANSEMPENIDLCICFFPDKDSFAEAAYRVGENELSYNNVRVSPGGLLYCLSPHLFGKMAAAKGVRKILESMNYCLMLALVANSEGEMEFKERTLDAILRENRGYCIRSRDCKPIGSLLVLNFLRASIIPLVFRMGGVFGAALAGDDTMDAQLGWSESAAEIKRKWISRGGILDDIVANPFLLPYDHNNLCHCEEIFLYDPRNRSQSEQLSSINADFMLSMVEHCLEPLMSVVPHVRKMLSPIMGDFNRWQRKISKALDPSGAADDLFYNGEADFDLSLLGEDIREKLERLL